MSDCEYDGNIVQRLGDLEGDINVAVASDAKSMFSAYLGDTPSQTTVLTKDVVKIIADGLTKSPEHGGSTIEPGLIPAGFTYFGQLLTHDILRPTRGEARENFTGCLDLGCIYPYLGKREHDQELLNNTDEFDVDGKFLLGQACGANERGTDLVRDASEKAIIPESRDDENVLISQLHLFWQHVHNMLVDTLIVEDLTRSTTNKVSNYNRARAFVTLLFQEITVNDYLPRVLMPEVYQLIITQGHSVFMENYAANQSGNKYLELPEEFSLAAFRFGHAMVLDRYKLNDAGTAKTEIQKLFRGKNSSGVCSDHITDWRLFFNEDSQKAARFGLRIVKAFTEDDVASQVAYSPTTLELENARSLNKYLKLRNRLIVADLVASARVPTANSIIGLFVDENVNIPGLVKVRRALDLKLYRRDEYLRYYDISKHGLIREINDQITHQNEEVLKENTLIYEQAKDLPETQKQNMLKGIKSCKQLLTNETAPFWLYVLHEADMFPQTVCPKDSANNDNVLSGNEHKNLDHLTLIKRGRQLGPFGSLVNAEVLRYAVQSAGISIYKQEPSHYMGSENLLTLFNYFCNSRCSEKMRTLVNYMYNNNYLNRSDKTMDDYSDICNWATAATILDFPWVVRNDSGDALSLEKIAVLKLGGYMPTVDDAGNNPKLGIRDVCEEDENELKYIKIQAIVGDEWIKVGPAKNILDKLRFRLFQQESGEFDAAVRKVLNVFPSATNYFLLAKEEDIGEQIIGSYFKLESAVIVQLENNTRLASLSCRTQTEIKFEGETLIPSNGLVHVQWTWPHDD